MKAKRWLAVILMLALMLAGCGSQTKEPNYIVSVMMYGTSVDTTASDNLMTLLNAQFPDLASKVDGIGAIIYANGGPEGTSANMSKISLDMNERKIGIVLSDKGGMDRLNGSAAMTPISDIFSAEELAAISFPTVSYQPKDAKGNPSGDPIIYGWDVSSSPTLSAILSDNTDEIGLVSNFPQKTYAKNVLFHLLTELDKN